MTQPTEEGAVGGSNEPVEAPELSIEDRFSAALGIEDEEQPEPTEEAEDAPEGEETEAADGEEDDTEGEAEEEVPSIAAPVSWTAEEKEEFSKLPRTLQETLTRREAEREKFVQSKAQEAKQTRSHVEQEAMAFAQQINEQHAKQLEAILPQIPAKPPWQLQNEDPYTFAEQMDAHERAVAQYHLIQQHMQYARGQSEHAKQVANARVAEETQAVIAKEFPEYLDPANGPKLRQELGSIAIALGYPAEQLANVDATDILAMRKVSELKAKADKYDTLMAKKMEKVREAKDMPKVSRPGVATGKGAQADQRYAADRKAMRSGNRDAAARVFERFV